MMQKLTLDVGAGGVVLLLVIASSLLPIGAAGERFALAGTLYAGWLTMSGVAGSWAVVGNLVGCTASASSQPHRWSPGSPARAL
jgi:hypothetical protein